MTLKATETTGLNVELSRLRRRAARWKPRAGSSTTDWQAWSDTIDEIAGVIEKMVAAPDPDLPDLSLQFRAILWQIEINESLLDRGDARRLKLFRRNLERLAKVRAAAVARGDRTR